MLEQLLERVCVHLDPQSDWPPPQDVECIAVASLNLLRLQVRKAQLFKIWKNFKIIVCLFFHLSFSFNPF